jgi:hypothetical protein
MPSQHLSKTEMAKLDMTFRALLEKNLLQQARDCMRISITDDSCKRYGAIIYTQNPDTIKKIGIHLNSTVNSFVTAQITIDELIKLAKLESVYAIKADQYETPDPIKNPVKDSMYSVEKNTRKNVISDKPFCLKQTIHPGTLLQIRFEMDQQKEYTGNSYPPEIQIIFNSDKHLELELISPDKDTLQYCQTGWAQTKYRTIDMKLESTSSHKVYKIKFLSPEYIKYKMPWYLRLENTLDTGLDCTVFSDDFELYPIN